MAHSDSRAASVAVPSAWAPLLVMVLASFAGRPTAAEEPIGIHDPHHGYETRQPLDRFTRLKAALEAGEVSLDPSGELPLLRSLLVALEVPVTSQLLVTSATSLQKRLVSPRRPRAIYFNDDTYVGFVPGGQMEVVSIDPELGGIFYLFDRFSAGRVPRVQRADNCMTCHAPRSLDESPGLAVESVIPGRTGGGEMAFRRGQSGHAVPLELRLGGWIVTGAPGSLRHRGNVIVEREAESVRERPVAPGELFDLKRYPVATSDIVPHLLLEHQVGFVNRAVQAAYRVRFLERRNAGHLEAFAPEIDALARGLVRYLLFADEVPLPSGGIEGDALFKSDFRAVRRMSRDGDSLRDFDLRTRLFAYRCSYMIDTPSYAGLPSTLKSRVEAVLAGALDDGAREPEFAYLSPEERRRIRTILRGDLHRTGEDSRSPRLSGALPDASP
jgi:hypothetical protein